MFTYPKIDPVALDLGFIQIHWYGLMYLTAFALAFWLGNIRASKPGSGWTKEQVSDLIFYGALGVVLGGRIGYMLFYNFPALMDNPLNLFKVWEGGMSFHGGLLGVAAAMYLFGRRYKKGLFDTTDFMVPLVPLGYFAGRIGNFINGELWGRPTDVPWAMVFPDVDDQARHASMLYQGLLEGLVLFLILWFYSSKPRPHMAVSGLCLLGFGVFRFFLEFFREPDKHLGFIAMDWMTMGQLLSIPLALAGMIIMIIAYRKNEYRTVDEMKLETAAVEKSSVKKTSTKKNTGKKRKRSKS